MEQENKKRLENIIGTFKDNEEKAKQKFEKTKQEQDTFLSEFEALCSNTIEPIMKEIGEYLKANDFNYHVSVNKKNTKESGIAGKSHIKIQIFRTKNPNLYGAWNEYPHVMFIGDDISKDIQIHENTISAGRGGTAGVKGCKYKISDLTAEIIEKEIIDSVEKIIGNKY